MQMAVFFLCMKKGEPKSAFYYLMISDYQPFTVAM